MQWKKTLIVAVVFAALLAWYLHDQHNVQQRQITSIKESRIVPFPLDELTAIEFINPSATLRLERGDNRWWITTPARARTNSEAVAAMTATLMNGRRNEPFPVQPDQLANYGLTSPRLTLRFEATGREPFTLNIGGSIPAKTAHYAAAEGAPDVFTIDGSTLGELRSAMENLRDTRTLFANLTAASAVDLATSTSQVRLEKSAGRWQITQPEPYPADPDFMREFLAEWNRQQVLGYDTRTDEKVAEYGLDRPWLTASVTVVGDDSGATETLKLFVGDLALDTPANAQPYYFAMRENDEVIFALGKDFVENTLAPKSGRFRDHHVFTMPRREVGVMRFTNIRGSSIAVERTGEERWVFTDGETGTVDQRAAGDMLTLALDLKAAALFGPDVDPVGAGFDRPIEIVELMNRDRTATETLIIGRQHPDEMFSWALVPQRDLLVGLDWRDPGKFIVTKEDFEDRTLLEFDEALVNRVELIAAGRTVVVDAREGGWVARIEGQTQPVTIDADVADRLIFSLRRLQWESRLNPQRVQDVELIESAGLHDPPQIVHLYDVEGNRIAEIGQGRPIDERKSYFVVGEEFYAVDQKVLFGVIDPINKILGALGEK